MDALQLVESCVLTHGGAAWRLAVSLTGNTADADDVVQQTFIIAWRKADQAPRDPWPWLAGIIANEARNLRRKRATRSHAPLSEDAAMNLDHGPERNELNNLLRGALSTLPPDQREALVLTHISGFTQQEAADLLGVPLNTLKARVRRGLDTLHDRLKCREQEITETLGSMPVAAPLGGLAAAQSMWLAGVKQHVAAAAASTASAAKVKLLALGTIAALAVVALILVLLQSDFRPQPQFETISDRADEESSTSGRSRGASSGDVGTGTARGNQPRTGGERIDGVETGSEGRRPPPGANTPRTSGNDPGLPPREGIEPQPEPEPAEEGRDNPVASRATAESRAPMLWIQHWPQKAKVAASSPVDRARALKDFKREWSEPDSDAEQRWIVLANMPNGSDDLVAPIMQALAAPEPELVHLAAEWIEREDDKRALKSLEQFLWRGALEDAVGTRLMRAMFRNPHWVDEKKWETGVAQWLRRAPAAGTALAPAFVLEIGHVRGDVGGIDNLARARMLFDIADRLDATKESERDPALVRNLRVALENMARAGFVDSKDRARAEKDLRASEARPNVLMRVQRTYDVLGTFWDVTSIDVEGARATDFALLILNDPETTSEAWLPWMIEADLHFRCYLVDYRGWSEDMKGANDGPGYAAELAQRLETLVGLLGLSKFGVVAPGFMAPVGAELCSGEAGAKFAAIDWWPSHRQLLDVWSPQADKSRPYIEDMRDALMGKTATYSDWGRMVVRDDRLDAWLRGGASVGVARDQYQREPATLTGVVREYERHPYAWLSLYDFGAGDSVDVPVLLFTTRWAENEPQRSAFNRRVRRQHLPKAPMDSVPLWRVPPEEFVGSLMRMLEAEYLVRRRR
ncbi:MAG: sigma-70 family RNA polymerase sigma factor [Planctomycetes bacterium]|nr:sigma-70 family RNA polymerase sigma factor [Planctomycetota bacterium]